MSRQNRTRNLPNFFANLDESRVLLEETKGLTVEFVSCFELRPYFVLKVLGLAVPSRDRRVMRNLLRYESELISLELVSLPEQRVKRLVEPLSHSCQLRHHEDPNQSGAQIRVSSLCCLLQEASVLHCLSLLLQNRQRLIEKHRDRDLTDVLPDTVLNDVPYAKFNVRVLLTWECEPLFVLVTLNKVRSTDEILFFKRIKEVIFIHGRHPVFNKTEVAIFSFLVSDLLLHINVRVVQLIIVSKARNRIFIQGCAASRHVALRKCLSRQFTHHIEFFWNLVR